MKNTAMLFLKLSCECEIPCPKYIGLKRCLSIDRVRAAEKLLSSALMLPRVVNCNLEGFCDGQNPRGLIDLRDIHMADLPLDGKPGRHPFNSRGFLLDDAIGLAVRISPVGRWIACQKEKSGAEEKNDPENPDNLFVHGFDCA
jgi:hypothetical protein